MLEFVQQQSSELTWSDVREDVSAACRRIPPLWDLPNHVAVNPFLGFTGLPLQKAARTVTDGLGARVLPGYGFYQEKWADGEFGVADLCRAALRTGSDFSLLASVLSDDAEPGTTRPSEPVRTFAERFDAALVAQWHDLTMRSITRWCAVHASAGGSAWSVPQEQGRGLYASWREAEGVDRTLEILGMRGWRQFVRLLPARAEDAIVFTLSRIGIEPDDRAEYLYRLLAGVYGWASFFRRASWQRGDEPASGELLDLLAVRVCADAAVVLLLGGGKPLPTSAPATEVEDEIVQVALQEALEDGYARQMLSSLKPQPAAAEDRPAVQGVFCIDVRSEPLRRHLEAQSPRMETRGFAGFFGISLGWRAAGCESSARCPVLLKPAVTVEDASGAGVPSLAGATFHAQTAPAAAFSFVELLGLAYGIKMAADAVAARGGAAADGDATAMFSLDGGAGQNGVAVAARVDLAAGILKNMSFGKRFARLVMLCGHTGRSANNPHSAGLDCGACGGHGGAINARVAAAILNDPAVREGLAQRGVAVLEDTLFLPAVHETSSDDVTLLDVAGVPASHEADVAQLRTWLASAGEATRRGRAGALGIGRADAEQPGRLARLLRRRARDWSEVRPEWGLARNAAFIAARRGRTRGVDLGGRVFLHEYDAALDRDNSVLTLILSAPMVVASWINLQYFASTVDNDVLGAGDKALHNRVGTIGVVLGNGGDLRTGLAKQSVHAADGSWYHEPLRLQVVVEAPTERIDAVLARLPAVRELVEHGWVRLFALDPEAKAPPQRRLPAGRWEPLPLEGSFNTARRSRLNGDRDAAAAVSSAAASSRQAEAVPA